MACYITVILGIKEELDVKWPHWALVYTCLKIVQAAVITAMLYGVGLSRSEKPFVQALETIDSKLFSILNLGSAKEEVGNLLFRILSSLFLKIFLKIDF